MEKKGTLRQKRRPKGDPNPQKGPLGDLGPLKGTQLGTVHWQKMHLVKVIMAHSATDYGLNELGIKLQIDLGAHFMCD